MEFRVEPNSESIDDSLDGSLDERGVPPPAPEGAADEAIGVGDVTAARVLRIDEHGIAVAIGTAEATIDKSGIGSAAVAVGDVIDVLIERNDCTPMRVSKSAAERLALFARLTAAVGTEEVFMGDVIGEIRGGLAVDIGIWAMLPSRHAGVHPQRSLTHLVGRRFPFHVKEFQQKSGRVVLTRRALAAREQEAAAAERLASLRKGEVVTGVVSRFASFGAFVDLGGGVEGVLRNGDLAWTRTGHARNVVAMGQALSLQVLDLKDDGKVLLGRKQLAENPWDQVATTCPIGEVISGTVSSITGFGAFVALPSGLEGLVHVSEMSWNKRVRHPGQLLQVGQEVKALVLAQDTEAHRISLSIRRVTPDPWPALVQRLPRGTKIHAPITRIASFGIFVRLSEDIDGLVHVSDISHDPHVKQPPPDYAEGQEVEVVVLDIDVERQRASLGIKQLREDPWEALARAHPRGTKVRGPVTRTTVYGAFVEIAPGIDGLCHISELSSQRVERVEDQVKPGDTVEAVVLEVDPKRRRIALSLKALQEDIAYAPEGPATNSLAEALAPVVEKLSGGNAAAPPAADDALGEEAPAQSREPSESP